jgi:hypothetical protein
MLKKHRDLAATFGQHTERQFVATLTKGTGSPALRNGYYASAVTQFFRALRDGPTDLSIYSYLLLLLGGPMIFNPARQLRHVFHSAGNE